MKYTEVINAIGLIKSIQTTGLDVDEIFAILDLTEELSSYEKKYQNTLEIIFKDNGIEPDENGMYHFSKENTKVIKALEELSQKEIELKSNVNFLDKEKFKNIIPPSSNIEQISILKRILYKGE